jgi:hypothetical protein
MSVKYGVNSIIAILIGMIGENPPTEVGKEFGAGIKDVNLSMPNDQPFGEEVKAGVLSAIQDFAAAASTELQEIETSGLIGTEPGPDFGHEVVDVADFVVWRKTLNTGDPPPPEHPNALGELVSGAASDHDQAQLASTDLLETPPSPVEPGAIGDLVLAILPELIPGTNPGPPEEPGPPEANPGPPNEPPGPVISTAVHVLLGAPDLGASAFVHTGVSPEAHGPA